MRKPTLHSTARKAEYLLLTAYCWAPCGIPQSLERLSYFQPALGLFWWIEFSELAPISYLDDKFTIVQERRQIAGHEGYLILPTCWEVR
jgi:hypothetical protein